MLFAAVLIVPAISVAQVTAPGTVVRNVGSVAYEVRARRTRTTLSNEVRWPCEPLPSRAAIPLARYEAASQSTFTAGPTQCRTGNDVRAARRTGAAGRRRARSADPDSPAGHHASRMPAIRSSCAWSTSTAIATPTVIETVDVRVSARATGDAEVLRLSETGPNTGVFVGYIADRDQRGGERLRAAGRAQFRARCDLCRSDGCDATRPQADALVDPYGLVFDSQTGAPIDGARVRLIDVATGLAATVFGDDGVSRYPSEMVTGQPVTDQGGTQYSMPAGVFRFPLVAPGSYRLEVLPPGSFAFPSQRTIADLQTLPGAPFRLQPGSFGQSFVVTAAPAVAVDLPLDPAGESLLLRKSAGQQIATTGDFVQYTLTLQNNSEIGRVQQRADRRPAAGRRALPRGLAAPERRAHRRSAGRGRRRELHVHASRARASAHRSSCATSSSTPSRCAA